ncbi:MAG: sigma-70 family RNA polymerase sigma factor [Bdellovibrionales bacterium]|nr:sigma-70 family RNA polymerase sigma factor [Bdellovibrionales bacterium]
MLTASKSVIDVGWSVEAPDAESMDDLVSACRGGSPQAQQRLYECSHERVYRLLMRMVGREDAEDVLQQVFLQVFRTLGQFGGQSRFETWLYRVSVNESLQHLRKQRRRRWVSLESDVMDGQPDQERDFDHKELMEHALARLEPELRSLFLLREVEKLSYAEIAEAVQIPEGTVASRLSRARQLLKQHLVELGWEP